MRKRQEKRRERINAKKARIKEGIKRKFLGARTTPSDRWNFIRGLQLELMQKGVDENVAFLNAKRSFRKEQRHLEAYLKGHDTYTFGTREEEKNGVKYEVPNVINVL